MANNTNFLVLCMLMMMTTTTMMVVSVHPQMALSSTEDPEEDDQDEEADQYMLDIPSSPSSSQTRSRFLGSTGIVLKKGLRCDNSTVASNICNGVKASKGTGLLFCCKKHCRNVVSDKNNCGECGHKCVQGHRCCNGVCTNVFFNGGTHCGKCNNKCSPGVPCEYGFCGYA